jgi:Protein of unknown function (DUF3224)
MRRTTKLEAAFLVSIACLPVQAWSQFSSGRARGSAASESQQTFTVDTTKEEVAFMKSEELIHPDGRTGKRTYALTHAKAKITVHSSEAETFDRSADPALMEIHLSESFTGDIDGESTVRALQVQGGEHDATSLVSMQRFRGTLGGRHGTFVLQGSETVANGKIEGTWFVVPGSGTDDLAGLRGEGGFEGDFGRGSTGTLDYWFE